MARQGTGWEAQENQVHEMLRRENKHIQLALMLDSPLNNFPHDKEDTTQESCVAKKQLHNTSAPQCPSLPYRTEGCCILPSPFVTDRGPKSMPFLEAHQGLESARRYLHNV